MRTSKNTSKIIIASTVAFLATMISYSAFTNMHAQISDQQKALEQIQQQKADDYKDSYAYAVATRDLKAGEMVSDGDVDFKQFPSKNPNAYENRSDVVNKVLLQNISSGVAFTSAYIAKVSSDDITLKNGYRALTLPSDNFQGKSAKMVIGSNVDVYSASPENNWQLDNIRIISFENNGKAAATDKDSSADMTNASAITFEVPANSIAEFISNISKSKLVLVARNSSDKQVAYKPHSSGFAPSSASVPRGSKRHFSGGSSLPNLPKSVPFETLPGGGGLSGLPQPIKPSAPAQSVELIEANVKSKVTFD